MISFALAWVYVTAIKKAEPKEKGTVDVSAFAITGMMDVIIVGIIARTLIMIFA